MSGMSESAFSSSASQAKDYSHTKYFLALVDIVCFIGLTILFLWFKVPETLVRFLTLSVGLKYLIFPAYLLLLFLLYYVLTFPVSFYQSFIIEHKYNLTTQKLGAWFLDQLKSGGLSYILGLVVFGAFYSILDKFPLYWWLTVSWFWLLFSFILAKLVPVIIIPLFFKYKPVSDANLKERILALADKMGITLLDVFEIDLSKKTLKANAAFVGMGSTKRVLLADTLKDKYTDSEIEVILAHEFSHYKSAHLIKSGLINSFFTLLTFYFIFKTNVFTLEFFGLASLSELAALPLVILYMAVFGIIMQPLGNFISCIFERQADMGSLVVTQNKEAFISLMNKFSEQNLSDRNPHPIIKLFFFDHPPADERIKMAQAFSSHQDTTSPVTG